MAGTDPVSEIRAHYYDELSEHFLNLFPLIGVVLGLLGYSGIRLQKIKVFKGRRATFGALLALSVERQR